jgi:hypothetical protein
MLRLRKSPKRLTNTEVCALVVGIIGNQLFELNLADEIPQTISAETQVTLQLRPGQIPGRLTVRGQILVSLLVIRNRRP